MAVNEVVGNIKSITKTDTEYVIKYETGETSKLFILNSHVFRYYMSPTGEFHEYPEPYNPDERAKINIKKTSDYNKKAFKASVLEEDHDFYKVSTHKIIIIYAKNTGTMVVHDKRTDKIVFQEIIPLSYGDSKITQVCKNNKDEYFFGGGMQNGRFSHKGEIIKIVNTNSWSDGGVTSPCPFYWSSYGYGILRNTWQPGTYDFGSKDNTETTHTGEYYDAFFFINLKPKDILNDYYELTGQPIFMPEFIFYEAHLNAFNRDYWVKVDAGTPRAIQFEDGNYYKIYKPNEMDNKVGILESLNGEKNNYQFSARAMIDRYKKYDMPLGWFIPNDGYGSGYGQTDSLDGDIANLKSFTEYAYDNGVQVALWTESKLEPSDPTHPKKGERDLSKEVGVANVVALKCDVAWIGSGYSFGLNAVEKATNVFKKSSKLCSRPVIIMVDGWAGTQRYSGIWSGDQSGGVWEYIRFHIPTYIGSGLSGQPIVGSDMDGIYGGKLKNVNVRDYQWKIFTPLQLNMDGWGDIPKYPFSFDSEATNINRAYLKLKSMLMPYNYTIGYEAIQGLPMVRAMLLEFPKETIAYTRDSQYQFMWGPNILVAPIYDPLETTAGNSLRHGIYLPDENQIWIDLFTGDKYQGGKIYNNFIAPLWKIPVFIKDGAVIPVTEPNNNVYEIKRDKRMFLIYPNGESNFTVYEDDGMSTGYLEGFYAQTKVSVVGPASNDYGNLYIHIEKSTGSYDIMTKEKSTILQIMASDNVKDLRLAINGSSIPIKRVNSDEEYKENVNVYFFNRDFIVNPYLTDMGRDALLQQFVLVKIKKIDVTINEIQLKINGYTNKSEIFGSASNLDISLDAPSNLAEVSDKITATSIPLQWNEVDNAFYYEIERDGYIFSNILGNAFQFDGFKYETEHKFRIRSVTSNSVSKWSSYVTVKTKEDPYKHTVKGVTVTCNLPCQPSQEICNLTDGDITTMWHTNWGKLGKANPEKGKIIRLNFDLQFINEIDKLEYISRDDAGNGTFLQVQYRTSTDGKIWTQFSGPIDWLQDNNTKTIKLNGIQFRYMELQVLATVGGFGSGKHVLFYKNI